MNHTPQRGKKLTFEQQQDLNYIRNTAMGTACAGLTTKQLKELNPNLIAAAPDLLEALKQILDVEPDYRKANRFAKIYQIAEAAIAKAEGGDADDPKRDTG